VRAGNKGTAPISTEIRERHRFPPDFHPTPISITGRHDGERRVAGLVLKRGQFMEISSV
jgi:hypothetical protein